jgi:hypothetical protein
MRLYIGVDGTGGGDLPNVWTEGFDLPPGTEVWLRDYSAGDEPDERGDIYEDTLLEVVR